MKANHLSLSNVFSLVLLLGLFGMTARPAVDPDLWWHLRTVQWIVETGHDLALLSVTRKGVAYPSHADLR